MPDILIRDVDPDKIERLKKQAADNGRSMQAEAKSILENGIKMPIHEWLERVRVTREQIGTAHQGPDHKTSVELIRELRDERDEHILSVIEGPRRKPGGRE
ncbi:MAG: FitA-like ribbon-helix-helix domain-containing protein [Coriobacteriia bacterium]